jgi:1-deoxy-D-xylulose-5-phosphate reductoisomerase
VRFPALRLARAALAAAGRAALVLNAANEIAVAAFLASRIGFLSIARVVEETLAAEPLEAPPDLDAVLEADLAARRRAEALVARLAV